MESVLSGTFESARETPTGQRESVSLARTRNNSWVFAGCLLAWLGTGGFLSWLIADFGKAYGEKQSVGISLLIFSMFVLSAVVVGLIRWTSFGAPNSAKVD